MQEALGYHRRRKPTSADDVLAGPPGRGAGSSSGKRREEIPANTSQQEHILKRQSQQRDVICLSGAVRPGGLDTSRTGKPLWYAALAAPHHLARPAPHALYASPELQARLREGIPGPAAGSWTCGKACIRFQRAGPGLDTGGTVRVIPLQAVSPDRDRQRRATRQ